MEKSLKALNNGPFHFNPNKTRELRIFKYLMSDECKRQNNQLIAVDIELEHMNAIFENAKNSNKKYGSIGITMALHSK